jgi:hypothetical protein
MERCLECGYGYDSLGRDRIPAELRRLAVRYAEVLGRSADGRLRRRPRTEVWSALEYACHVRDVLRVQKVRVDRAISEDHPDFESMRREERVLEERYNAQVPAEVAGEIALAADGLACTLEALDDAGWARTGVYHWPTTEVRTVEWIGRHTVHEGTHHLRDIAQQETQSA